jgi:uncharacterized Zn-finger protein
MCGFFAFIFSLKQMEQFHLFLNTTDFLESYRSSFEMSDISSADYSAIPSSVLSPTSYQELSPDLSQSLNNFALFDIVVPTMQKLPTLLPAGPIQPVILNSSLILNCPFPGCTKTFTRHRNLRTHERTHQTIHHAECQLCGATFKRNPDLQRHVRSTHSNERPHECPYHCGRSFSRKDALKRHLECKDKRAVCAGFRKL